MGGFSVKRYLISIFILALLAAAVAAGAWKWQKPHPSSAPMRHVALERTWDGGAFR